MSLVVPKYDAAYSLLLVNGEDALLWSMLTCLLDLDDHLQILFHEEEEGLRRCWELKTQAAISVQQMSLKELSVHLGDNMSDKVLLQIEWRVI